MKIVSRSPPTLTYAYRTGVKEAARVVLLACAEGREIAKHHSDPHFINAVIDVIEDRLIATDWVTFDE